MRGTIEVELNGLRAAGKIFDVLGCDGALRLHLPNTKSTLRYLDHSETLILSEIRKAIF